MDDLRVAVVLLVVTSSLYLPSTAQHICTSVGQLRFHSRPPASPWQPQFSNSLAQFSFLANLVRDGARIKYKLMGVMVYF